MITTVALALALGAASVAMAQPVAGDFDDDRDVDVFDHARLVECLTGPGIASIPTACLPGDFDEDEDIDLLDWAAFQAGFGVGQSPRIDRLTPPPGDWIVDDTGLATLSIGFDRHVTIPGGAIASWTVNGGDVVPSNAEYDPIQRLLTLTFDPAIQNDRVTLVVDYAITDSDGNELDGEIDDPANATLPSGDGVRGGQAVFRINVLQGDANRDGIVDASDEAIIQAAIDTCTGDPAFDPLADLDASGCVDQQDVDIFTAAQGNSLPMLDGTRPEIVDRAPGIDERYRDHDLGTVVLALSEDFTSQGLSPSSLYVIKPGGFLHAADTLFIDESTATFTFEAPPPPNTEYRFNVTNAFSDASGELLSTDAVTRWLASIDDTPTTIIQTSPSNAESMVALSRETIITFRDGIDPLQELTPNAVKAEFGGQVLAMGENSPRIMPDGKHLKLFYDLPLPASARVRVTIDGNSLLDDLGNLLDADGDGVAGGTRIVDFDTCTIARIPDTILWGYVYASEIQGPNEENIPIEGVTIKADGFPFTEPCDGDPPGELCAVTDETGLFWLGGPAGLPPLDPGCAPECACDPEAEGCDPKVDCQPGGFVLGVPAPEFFAHVDGRTAISRGGEPVPDGYYYPNVGKPFHSIPGHCVQIFMDNEPFSIFLPRIADESLVLVPENLPVTIGFNDDGAARFAQLFPDLNPALANLVQLTIPAGSLTNDNGAPGNMAGIFPIDSTRLPAPLPGGQVHRFDITVQTDGATNFDLPAPLCLPNLPDPETDIALLPGEQTGLVSFNHDTGKWEYRGTMTAGPDGDDDDEYGDFVCPDEGVGVAAPGWHGQAQPPFRPPPPCTSDCCDPPCCFPPDCCCEPPLSCCPGNKGCHNPQAMDKCLAAVDKAGTECVAAADDVGRVCIAACLALAKGSPSAG